MVSALLSLRGHVNLIKYEAYKGIMASKQEFINQDYRQKTPISLADGKRKAAKMTYSWPVEKRKMLSQYWDDAIVVFGDYFIRY